MYNKVRIVENGIVYPNDPYLYYVGRWNNNNITQWAGSGFKFDFSGTSFTFVSGEKSYPLVEIGYSIDYQEMQYKILLLVKMLLLVILKTQTIISKCTLPMFNIVSFKWIK